MHKDDSTIVSDSPFYPEPNYNYIKDTRYKTYPHNDMYKNGMPVYKYPYSSTLNNTEYFTNEFNHLLYLVVRYQLLYVL